MKGTAYSPRLQNYDRHASRGVRRRPFSRKRRGEQQKQDTAADSVSLASEVEAAGADFASFSERFEGVLKRLASTISGVSSWKEAPVSPSDEPRALLNATEKNRVLQDDIAPDSRASSPSLPERPPSPAAAMTANDKINQLLEGLKEDPLRQAELQAAIRTRLKARNSTLQSSIKDASFAATSDSSINTVPSPAKSIVDSATLVTPMTPTASLPPASGQLAGSPPVATPPPAPEAGPETKAPITTSQTPDRVDVVDDVEADAIAAEVDEMGPNSDDDASVQSKDTDNDSGYESDPEGGSEGGEKPDNSLKKL